MTCLIRVRDGMTRHSIWPLTGRVGNLCGPICPAQAPAQFTIFRLQKDVFEVVTPEARPFVRSTEVTGSPEEKSTPRFFAVLRAAAVRARGSTERSLR